MPLTIMDIKFSVNTVTKSTMNMLSDRHIAWRYTWPTNFLAGLAFTA